MQYKEFTVVLPTLNEGKNVAELVSRLKERYSGISVIVADDGSKDDTREEAVRMNRKYGNVKVIDRKKLGRDRGLTASVIDGIRDSKTKYVIIMDADLQHPYQIVGKIAERLVEGDKVAVGIRAEVENWPFYRKFVSKSLIIIGYAVLLVRGSQSCGDIFSGFFGVDKKFFMNIYSRNRNRFVGRGFKVLFDLLKCVKKNSIQVSDVPYVFRNRKFGESKAGAKQVLDLLRSFAS
jgi:Glycosyltransferases involved in cell wall biogenesis